MKLAHATGVGTMASPPDDSLLIKIVVGVGVLLTFIGTVFTAAVGMRSKREETFITQLREDNASLRGELTIQRNEINELRRVIHEQADELSKMKGLSVAYTSLDELYRDAVGNLASANGEILNMQRMIAERDVQMRFLIRNSEVQQFQILNLSGVTPLSAPMEHLMGTLDINIDGVITSSDPGTNVLYGAPLVGQSVLQLIPARFYGGHLRGFVQAVSSPENPPHPSEVPMLRADGSEIQVSLKVDRIREGFRVTLRAVATTVDGGTVLR